MQPYATGSVTLGSAEGPFDSNMTHSYRLTEGRLFASDYPTESPIFQIDESKGHMIFTE